MHRAEQVGAELVEQTGQQDKQPVLQIVRMRQNQLVDGVQEQGVHLDVRIHEHLAEQVQHALELLLRQHLAFAEVLRQIDQPVLALGPVRRGAELDDRVDIVDHLS